jgi:hypothetical protein
LSRNVSENLRTFLQKHYLFENQLFKQPSNKKISKKSAKFSNIKPDLVGPLNRNEGFSGMAKALFSLKKI